jgi:hypothetical protein
MKNTFSDLNKITALATAIALTPRETIRPYPEYNKFKSPLKSKSAKSVTGQKLFSSTGRSSPKPAKPKRPPTANTLKRLGQIAAIYRLVSI